MVLPIISCNLKESDKKLSEQKNDDACLSSSLTKAISDYITPYAQSNVCSFITSIYIGENDSIKYFTIWQFTAFPNYVEHINPDKEFKYYYHRILNENVVVICDNEFSPNKFYMACEDNLIVPENADTLSKENCIYDGSWLPRTYVYNISTDSIWCMKADEAITDILGPEYLEFEDYINRKNLKYRP